MNYLLPQVYNLNKNSTMKTYWNVKNASNPYITCLQMGISSYLYLPADAGRTLFPCGGFSPSAILNNFGFLFWSIYQQRSKANFLFNVSNQHPSRQKGHYHWVVDMCAHIPLLFFILFVAFVQSVAQLLKEWVRFLHLLSLMVGQSGYFGGNWSKMLKMLGRTESELFKF